MPKCSNNIFIPNIIKNNPPIIVDILSYLVPNLEPIITPIYDSKNVIAPINKQANNIFTFKNEKVIPIDKASILVAKEYIIIFLKLTSSILVTFLLNDSIIILIPIIFNKINIIQ